MAAVQHIYSGEGSPITLGIQAQPGSHYINELDASEVWLSTFHETVDGVPYTEWVKLSESFPPSVLDNGGDFFMTEGQWLGADLIKPSGAVHFIGEGTIFSNIEPVQTGNQRSFSLGQPYRAQVAITGTGAAVVMVTAMFLTELSVEV